MKQNPVYFQTGFVDYLLLETSRFISILVGIIAENESGGAVDL
jgi:hypothetical protein